MIVQQESENNGGFLEEPKIAINTATTTSGASGTRSYGQGKGSNSNKVCKYCGKSGHIVKVCYRKHGFPLHFKFKNSTAIAQHCGKRCKNKGR